MLEVEEDTFCSKVELLPPGLRLLSFDFEVDVLSAGWGGKNFLMISRGSFSFGS